MRPVLHIDGRRDWAGGQNQVRLLMREFARRGINQLCVCPSGSALEQRLRGESLPVTGLPWRRGLDPRAMLAILRRARRCSVIHAHDAHGVQAALPAALLWRLPLVATRRSLLPTSRLKWNRAARVIAISGAVQQLLRRSGIDEHRIRLIPSAIDVDEVRALAPPSPTLRELLQLEPGTFLAGNVATLTGYKRQIQIPRAATHLKDVHWVIIGEGSERPVIESSIREQGVSRFVHLTGNLPDARSYLRELDVLVFPSVGEPLGTTVLDAMAVGLPVVAADSAGPGEILRPVHQKTGISLFPPDDAETLAAYVTRIRDEADLRQRVIEAQYQRLRDFRIESLADAVLKVYDEVLPVQARERR